MVRERGISSVIREIRNAVHGKIYISIDMDEHGTDNAIWYTLASRCS